MNSAENTSEEEWLFGEVTVVEEGGGEEAFNTLVDEQKHKTTTTKEWRKEASPTEWLLEYRGPRLLIDFALDHRDEPERPFNITQMASETGVARPTIYDHIGRVLESNVLRKEGTSTYYVNAESPILDAYAALKWAIREGSERDQ